MKTRECGAGGSPFPKALVGLWREFLRPLGLLFLVIAPLKSAVVDWNWVPTGSMKPTIMVGDLVLVNKLAYDLKIPFATWHVASWSEPARGDIVVFFSPADGSRLVKRVVGLPGDTVELRREALYINGIRQGYALADPLPYSGEVTEDPHPMVVIEHLGGRDHLVALLPSRPALRSFGPLRVPAGCYFMMGDSRDNSFDSRYFGTVPRASIVGRATAVIVSFDPTRCLLPRFSRFLSPFSSGEGRPSR